MSPLGFPVGFHLYLTFIGISDGVPSVPGAHSRGFFIFSGAILEQALLILPTFNPNWLEISLECLAKGGKICFLLGQHFIFANPHLAIFELIFPECVKLRS